MGWLRSVGLNYWSLLLNIVSFIELCSKRDQWFNRSYWMKPPHIHSLWYTCSYMYILSYNPMAPLKVSALAFTRPLRHLLLNCVRVCVCVWVCVQKLGATLLITNECDLTHSYVRYRSLLTCVHLLSFPLFFGFWFSPSFACAQSDKALLGRCWSSNGNV